MRGGSKVLNGRRHRMSALPVGILALLLPLPAAAAQMSSAQDASPEAVQGSGDVSLWTEFAQGGEGGGIEELVETWNAKGNGITVTHRPIGNEEFFTVIRTA